MSFKEWTFCQVTPEIQDILKKEKEKAKFSNKTKLLVQRMDILSGYARNTRYIKKRKRKSKIQ